MTLNEMDRLTVGSKIEYKLFDTTTGEYKWHQGTIISKVLRYEHTIVIANIDGAGELQIDPEMTRRVYTMTLEECISSNLIVAQKTKVSLRYIDHDGNEKRVFTYLRDIYQNPLIDNEDMIYNREVIQIDIASNEIILGEVKK